MRDNDIHEDHLFSTKTASPAVKRSFQEMVAEEDVKKDYQRDGQQRASPAPSTASILSSLSHTPTPMNLDGSTESTQRPPKRPKLTSEEKEVREREKQEKKAAREQERQKRDEERRIKNEALEEKRREKELKKQEKENKKLQEEEEKTKKERVSRFFWLPLTLI